MTRRSNPLLDRHFNESRASHDSVILGAMPGDLSGSQLSRSRIILGLVARGFRPCAASEKAETPTLPTSLYNRAIHA